jgi:hypothetical protein
MNKKVEVTPELLGQVREVLDMAAKGRYSTSKVYAAYNAVTGKNDPPQTCASCLRNRVRVMKEWYEKQAFAAMLAEEAVNPAILKELGITGIPLGGIAYTDNGQPEGGEPIGKPDGDTAPPQDEERPDVVEPSPTNELRTVLMNGAPIDVIRLSVPALELPVYFEPGDKDPNKGKACYEGGGSIKPGKYVTSDDRELAVQPGGKATLKAAPDNDLL